MQHAFAENLFVPTRFACGVPARDYGLCEYDADEDLELHVAPYDPKAGESVSARRASSQRELVFWHQLFPIVPRVEIGSLDGDVSERDAWLGAMHTAGYVARDTGAEAYYAMIGTRGLFGGRLNPLESVFDLSKALRRPELLLHHVLAVALQFYLCVRGAFLRQRTDAEWTYDESLPPCVFMMFPGADWGVGEEVQLDATELGDSPSDLEAAARDTPFPVFLWRVLQLVSRRHPFLARSACATFCLEKVRKNFVQSLTTMRFRELLPVNLAARLTEAGVRPAPSATIKFFARPNACRMRSAKTRGVPQFFCHAFFAADAPLVTDDVPEVVQCVDERQRHLLWHLLLYFPLKMFAQLVDVEARKLWHREGFTVLPTTAVDKYKEYDAYVPLSPVRARYLMYFEENRATAFVPNLALPDLELGVLPHDECDPAHITPDAWEWMVARGSRIQPMKREADASDADESTRRHLLALDTVPLRRTWFWFWARAAEARSEEYAAYCVHQLGRTLADVQASYAAFRDEATAHAAPASREWDRCTRVPCTVPHLRTYWRVLFPVSVVTRGGAPWVASWRALPPMPRLAAARAIVRRELARPELLKELRATPADAVPPELRDFWTSLTQSMETDSSSSSSNASSPMKMEE
ncbi:MAG: hypothetical protein Q7V62_15225 [Actinomycetota bacterium]|nr:hypothetical protein [Actinomycetota bacterium]